ncbi:MAG: hypothetical protein Q4G45_10220 [Actinomycetia bacterium]|nr:hypothetical protein [Actinomycetes bacterium]
MASSRPAVATSGTQERGEHVWRLGADDSLAQVTVAAAGTITADVLATTVLAGGPTTLKYLPQHHNIDVLTTAADGQVWASPALSGLTCRGAAHWTGG